MKNIDYYNKIKEKLIKNESYIKVKDYSKNKHTLQTYYEVGKLLYDAGKYYGEGIVKQYTRKLMLEVNKKYSVRYLYDMKKLYMFLKVHPLGAQLSMSYYRLLFPIKDENEIKYYYKKCKNM